MIFQILVSVCWVGGSFCGRVEDEFQRRAELAISELVIEDHVVQRMPALQDDVERVLKEIWPDARVVRYGSIDSHTGTRGSDIDLTVVLPDAVLAAGEMELLARARRVLADHPRLFAHFVVPDALVNILQCVHLPTGIDIDLSINRLMSVQNIAMNRYFVDLDRRVFQIAIITKRWAKLHGVKIHQKFTNYDMLLLVIFYMQQEKVVPPVSLLQRDAEPYFIGVWNAGFRELEYHTNNTKSLYELLGGFFEYYSEFEYGRYVISVFAGYPVERAAFRDLHALPAEFALYKHNVLNDISQPLDLSHDFILQECFELNDRAGQILNVQEFTNAAEAFKKYKSTKFLEYLLTEEKHSSNTIHKI